MENTILFYPFDFSLHITHRCHTFGAPSAADGVAIAESSGMSRCEARASNSRKYPIMVNLPTLFVYNFYMSGLNWRIYNYFPCSCINISIMLPYLKLSYKSHRIVRLRSINSERKEVASCGGFSAMPSYLLLNIYDSLNIPMNSVSQNYHNPDLGVCFEINSVESCLALMLSYTIQIFQWGRCIELGINQLTELPSIRRLHIVVMIRRRPILVLKTKLITSFTGNYFIFIFRDDATSKFEWRCWMRPQDPKTKNT